MSERLIGGHEWMADDAGRLLRRLGQLWQVWDDCELVWVWEDTAARLSAAPPSPAKPRPARLPRGVITGQLGLFPPFPPEA